MYINLQNLLEVISFISGYLSLNVYGAVTEWAVLPHGHVLLVGPVVADHTGPVGPQVHQRSTSHDTNRKLGPTTWTRGARVRDHGLTARALGPVGPRVFGTVFDKYIHG